MKKFAFVLILVLVVSIIFSGCGPKQSLGDYVASSGNDTSQDSEGEEESVPDFSDAAFTEETIAEYFYYLTETYTRNFFLNSVDDLLGDSSYTFLYMNLQRESVLVSFDGLGEYISDAEIESYKNVIKLDDPNLTLINDPDVLFRVQKVEDMQKDIDQIWGKDRIDLWQILYSQANHSGAFLSEDLGILISTEYMNERYELTPFFQIEEIIMDEGSARIVVRCVSVSDVSFFSDTGYAIDETDGRVVGDLVESGWLKRNSDVSFDQVVSSLSIDRSTLGAFVFNVVDTPDGPRLDSFYKENNMNFSSVDIFPETMLDYISHSEVGADVGLNMRAGPGTDYDVVTLLPYKNRVNELGFDDAHEGWMFASATVEGTEHIGWVNTDFINFYGGMAKPVIYLYPEKAMNVNVEVDFSIGGFTCTYPDYRDGWNVFAYPDGRVIDNADGLEYSYLYWEGEGRIDYDMSKGFVVKGDDTASFLREKLSYMGLTPREYNEFIVYWLPLMHKNPYNFITFQTTAYTDNVALNVTPTPDSMLRVYMVYRPLEEYRYVPEQELQTFDRNGFSVIEWGGTKY